MRTRALADLSPRELRVLFAEECAHWSEELLWDYSEVSAAVASGVERRALAGYAMQDGAATLGYCYVMKDQGRVVLGSVYAAGCARGRGVEDALVRTVLADEQGFRGSARVECQTLFTTGPVEGTFRRAGFTGLPRRYLVLPLAGPTAPGRPHPAGVLRPVRRDDLPRVADLVHRSHRGSLDAALNSTYATRESCRQFVDTLVLRNGCGRFDAEASAITEGGGEIQGVLLASRLSAGNGHVCQVSVAPEAQGRGVARALLASALASFRRQGLSRASLSVTAGNARAERLYERFGFVLQKAFGAYAWVRPPARLELPA